MQTYVPMFRYLVLVSGDRVYCSLVAKRCQCTTIVVSTPVFFLLLLISVTFNLFLPHLKAHLYTFLLTNLL